MKNRRMKRVDQLILEEVAAVIQNDLNDPDIGFVTIVDVDTASDLSHSLVYVSVLGSTEVQEASCAALNKAAPFIRTTIAPNVQIRHLPKLIFKLDHTAETAARIERLLAGKEV